MAPQRRCCWCYVVGHWFLRSWYRHQLYHLLPGWRFHGNGCRIYFRVHFFFPIPDLNLVLDWSPSWSSPVLALCSPLPFCTSSVVLSFVISACIQFLSQFMVPSYVVILLFLYIFISDQKVTILESIGLIFIYIIYVFFLFYFPQLKQLFCRTACVCYYHKFKPRRDQRKKLFWKRRTPTLWKSKRSLKRRRRRVVTPRRWWSPSYRSVWWCRKPSELKVSFFLKERRQSSQLVRFLEPCGQDLHRPL